MKVHNHCQQRTGSMGSTFGSGEEVAHNLPFVQWANLDRVRRRAIAALSRYIFQGIVGQSRKDHGHMAGSTGLGCSDFTVCMGQSMHGRRRDAEGHCGRLAPQRGARVDVRHVA